MKNIKTILGIIFIFIEATYSQLPITYPYKSIMSNNGDIYVACDTIYPDGSKDFCVKRYIGGDMNWRFKYLNFYGNDKAFDVVVDEKIQRQYCYATGFVYNHYGKEELLVTKLLKSTGDSIWIKKYSLPNKIDTKGLGIALDSAGNIYVTGYIENKFNEKDILVLKSYRIDGDLLWEHRYSNPQQLGDDIGTDIITDENYVYVLGSSFRGIMFKNDVVLLSYPLDGSNEEVDIFPKQKTYETPTGFVISGHPFHANDKSRISITSISDRSSVQNSFQSEYVTLTYLGDSALTLQWSNTYKRESTGQNVATSIDADEAGNVYVSGYSYSLRSDFDYATIKYNENGGYGWLNNPVQVYDSAQGKDKGSSVKVNGNLIYVTGSSDMALGGFKTIQYEQDNNGNIHKVWESDFIPHFDEFFPNERAAEVHVDKTTGNIVVFTMQWGQGYTPQYAIRGYTQNGDILFTVDYGDTGDDKINLQDQINEKTDYTLSQNYPNPFNPSTIIKYEIKNKAQVTLKIYNALGKEIKTLVNENKTPGNYSVKFDGSDLPSGIYYYKLTAGNFNKVMRMILVK